MIRKAPHLLCALGLLAAGPAAAQPVEPMLPPTAEPAVDPTTLPLNDPRAFESGFAAGQALFDGGQYLAAARTWTETAALLPEGPDNRDNRIAVFEYIADAYERALAGDVPRERVDEALAVLDRYAEEFAAAYGQDAALGPKVLATRSALRARLAPKPAPAPKPEGPVAAPPLVQSTQDAPAWRGLAVGGGLGLGLGIAGLALFTAGAVQAKSLERRFDDPARGCDPADLAGECGEIYRAGKAAQTQAIVGAVVGTAGAAAGAALVALALKKRRGAPTLAPRLDRGFAGLALQARF